MAVNQSDSAPCSKCKERTAHRSQICRACRTRLCAKCGVEFTAKGFGVREHCTYCQGDKKRKPSMYPKAGA